jgi:hypothetical protein
VFGSVLPEFPHHPAPDADHDGHRRDLQRPAALSAAAAAGHHPDPGRHAAP